MNPNSFSKKRIITTIIVYAVSAILILVGLANIKLDSSLYNLLPYDQTMIRSLELSQKSGVGRNVLIYIDKTNEEKFHAALDFINGEISGLPVTFENAIPNANDITQMMNYFQENSLLLYPYEELPNPFSAESISKGLEAKLAYIQNMPFFTGSSEFFKDPMMAGLQALNYANSMTPTEYFPQYEGVVSADKTAYLKILSVDFGTEDYDKIACLAKLDKTVKRYSKTHKIDAFIYCAHLYFWDSMKRITREISVIFVLSIVLTLFIFFIFYKSIFVVIYVFMPIIASFALTFVTIALFRGRFGAIALAFGATTAGITIDYSIHYISKINFSQTLHDVRKKIAVPMILGVATTILSLSFLFFSRIVSLQEIALFGVLAIGYSFVFSFFVMQPLLAPTTIDIPCRMVTFRRPSVKGVAVWGLLTLFFLIGTIFTPFEDNVMMMDMKHRSLDKRISRIQKHFSESTDSTFLVFSGDTTDDVLYNNFRAFEVLQKAGIHINTPSLFVPSSKTLKFRRDFVAGRFNQKVFAKCVEDSAFEPEAFEEYVAQIGNIQKLPLSPLPDFLKRHLQQFFVRYNDKVCLMIHIPTREQLLRIDKLLTEWQVPHFTASPMLDSRAGLVRFESNAMKLLFLSLLAIVIILMVHFRNVIYGLLAVAPMFVALISSFGIGFWTGRGFNIMHFAASIVVLGISVDYGIYIVDAYRHRYTPQEINTVILSMFISGLTTLAGFGVLVISSNRSIFSLGSAMFVGIVMAFLTAYLFVGFVCQRICSSKEESDSDTEH